MFTMYSQRGFPQVVYEGFKYSKCGIKNALGQQKWRCAKKLCPAFLITDEAEDVILARSNKGHNHEQCPHLWRQYVTNAAKLQAVVDASTPTAKLVMDNIALVPEVMAANMTRTEIIRVKTILRRAIRNKRSASVLKSDKGKIVNFPGERFIYCHNLDPIRINSYFIYICGPAYWTETNPSVKDRSNTRLHRSVEPIIV